MIIRLEFASGSVLTTSMKGLYGGGFVVYKSGPFRLESGYLISSAIGGPKPFKLVRDGSDLLLQEEEDSSPIRFTYVGEAGRTPSSPNQSREPRPSSALRKGERSCLGLAAFHRSATL
jgi:hypothetical protein